MQNQPDALMLFAAGFGTRMGILTADTPKPMIKVAGKPLIDHAFQQIDAAKINTVVVNTHYHASQVSKHISGRPNVHVVHEASEILETGGGLRNALPKLGSDPVFTMNTDAVWTGPNPLNTLLQAWDPDRMDALLLLVPRENAIGHSGSGDFEFSDNGHLIRGPGDVYSGLQIIKTEGLKTIPDKAFSLNLLWDSMLLDERLFGVVHDGGWCDVGKPESIALAETMLSEAKDV
ncbi:nucleotidyltransferase family protein [Actibacterium lipolyticum]|uniref:D-glycero-alpha-D-manno-heptose 1-phosphate guanylyltransferase n=1 Tax=Actibacterium lipolyticum TaxID=1524263 RepID=A0A238KWG8_9RHOB|nr:nucleotidyltransferase family protein [Actibacterium lipolyticum]SMX47153.1 D-glycero-alpha-D-manno-heptose 1-phosphate guanylyltransferase [Actibacterium lipolyticum]